MSFHNALAGVAVRDMPAALAFYERLLGRAADSHPMPEVAEWHFERGGWVQVFEDAERAGASSVTLAVDDLDATVRRLEGEGMLLGERSDGALVRTAFVFDPEGNRIVLAEAHAPGLAQ